MKLALTSWLLALCLMASCEREVRSPIATAEFGIFYGGQIQERRELPFQLDATKQQQGFRVVFSEPLEHDARVRWELSRPAPTTARQHPVSRPEGRVTELGEATVTSGSRSFEQRFSFNAGDPLGLWNIRVTVDDHLAIDRPFNVFDLRARKRRILEHRRRDAGL